MKVENVIKKLIIFGLSLVIMSCCFFIYQVRSVDKKAQNEVAKIEDMFEVNSKDDVAVSLLTTEGALYIPTIDVKLPVYKGTSESALVNGVGIIEGTGNIDSIGENPILTAHNGLNNSTLLMNLDKIKIDDEFFTRNLDGKIRKYKVINIQTVEPEGEIDKIIKAGPEESLMTLRTCTPTFINSHRLLVTGVEVDFEGEEMPLSKYTISSYEKILIGISLFSLVAIVMILKRERGGESEEISVH